METLDMHGWDLEDGRESSIAGLIGANALVLWRDDIPWHPDETPADRCVFGMHAGEGGPEVFLATARTVGGREEPSMHMSTSLDRFFDGGLAEIRMGMGVHDTAVILELWMGDIRSVARHLNVGSAIHVLRVRPDGRGEVELAVTASRWIRKGLAKAEVTVKATRQDLKEAWISMRRPGRSFPRVVGA